MAINLKNYTSNVPAGQSISKLEKKLVEAGASDISKSYKDGVCVSVRFRLEIKNNTGIKIPMFFELPARVENAYKVFLSQRTYAPNEKAKQDMREQAEKTAWKIVAEWVEIQISMVLLEQADIMQVFLPYSFDVKTNTTFYEKLKENNFKGLLTAGE